MEKKTIEIMDTTLRDGEQTSGVSFMPHEKLMIARALLQNLNVDRIEVASARVSEGEKEAVKKQEEMDDLINEIAKIVLESNKEYIGNDVADRAIEKVEEDAKKTNKKEEKNDAKEKSRTRRKNS